MEEIHPTGGMLRAIEVGYVQKEIQEAAYRQQRAVQTGGIQARRGELVALEDSCWKKPAASIGQ